MKLCLIYSATVISCCLLQLSSDRLPVAEMGADAETHSPTLLRERKREVFFGTLPLDL